MKELRAFRGTAILEDSYCRIIVSYMAEKEVGWNIIFNHVLFDVIGRGTYRVDLIPSQIEMISETLREELEREALKDIKRQKEINEELDALRKEGL